MGASSINEPFSMAMLNNQRVAVHCVFLLANKPPGPRFPHALSTGCRMGMTTRQSNITYNIITIISIGIPVSPSLSL